MKRTFISLSSDIENYIVKFEDISGEILDCECRPVKEYKYIDMSKVIDDFVYELEEVGAI